MAERTDYAYYLDMFIRAQRGTPLMPPAEVKNDEKRLFILAKANLDGKADHLPMRKAELTEFLQDRGVA